MTILKKCRAHLVFVKEGYIEHALFALSFACRLQWAAIAVAIHALIPALFQFTGSNTIRKLHQEIEGRMHRHG